ncbi:MAG: patatin-like phospholipase RssA [Mariprofundaceae bacterium]|nr:patatin-like phospholipase RssA [Mariprofundaceae bacterium]
MTPTAENLKQLLPDADARIGIALGSGSARGWSHIGVLKALAEMGIKPGIVAGSSIGALVGAAYANNQLNELERWVCSLTWKEIISFLDLSVVGGGVIQGEKLFDFARTHMEGVRIDSLPIPFAAVATELETGREVWLRDGPLLEAIRASISLPGLFTPVKRDGQWLVDGGLVDPVPVSLCRAMGAEVVIAVNLNGDIVGKHGRSNRDRVMKEGNHMENGTSLWERVSEQLKSSLNERRDILLAQLFGENHDAPGLFEVMAGSLNIMQDRITRSRLAEEPPDIILEPRLSHVGLMDYDMGDEAITEGRACVDRMNGQLLKLTPNDR